jgi:hypothetical protein
VELDLWTCRTVPVHTPTAYGMLARELKLGKTTAASMLGHCLVGERGRGGARTGGERQHSAARGLLVSGGTHHCTRSHPATSLSGVCGAMSYTLHRRESHASIVHRCVVQRCSRARAPGTQEQRQPWTGEVLLYPFTYRPPQAGVRRPRAVQELLTRRRGT